MAKLELTTLLDKYDLIQTKFEELDSNLDNLIEHIPGVQQMLAIKGVGRVQLPASSPKWGIYKSTPTLDKSSNWQG